MQIKDEAMAGTTRWNGQMEAIDLDSSETGDVDEEQEEDDEIWLTPLSRADVSSSSSAYSESGDEGNGEADVIVISSDDEVSTKDKRSNTTCATNEIDTFTKSAAKKNTGDCTTGEASGSGDMAGSQQSDDGKKHRRRKKMITLSPPLSMTTASSPPYTDRPINNSISTDVEQSAAEKENIYEMPQTFWRSIRKQEPSNNANNPTITSRLLSPQESQKYQNLMNRALKAERDGDFENAEQLYLQCIEVYDGDSAVVLRLFALALHNGILFDGDFEHDHFSSASSTNHKRRTRNRQCNSDDNVEVIVIE